MARLYAFPRDQARVLRGVAGSILLRSGKNQHFQYGDQLPEIVRTIGIVKTGTTGISVASDAGGVRTVGTGVVTAQRVNADGDLEDVLDTDGQAVTCAVVNPTLDSQPTEDYLIALQGIWDDKLYVLPADENKINYKPLVRFTLGGALSTSDATASASITAQYGPGVDNSTSITVRNIETSTASQYIFEGASGAAGIAGWDFSQTYQILQLECPAV